MYCAATKDSDYLLFFVPVTVFPGPPIPTPAMKAVLMLAPRYTKGILPQSIAFHRAKFHGRYTSSPSALTVHKWPRSATSNPNNTVFQTRMSEVERRTRASLRANSRYRFANWDSTMEVPVGIGPKTGAEAAWVRRR